MQAITFLSILHHSWSLVVLKTLPSEDIIPPPQPPSNTSVSCQDQQVLRPKIVFSAVELYGTVPDQQRHPADAKEATVVHMLLSSSHESPLCSNPPFCLFESIITQKPLSTCALRRRNNEGFGCKLPAVFQMPRQAAHLPARRKNPMESFTLVNALMPG